MSLVVLLTLVGCGGGGKDSEGCSEAEQEAAVARCERCLDSCSNCDDPLAACTVSCRGCDE
jgi:hypothetical protein